MIVNMSAVASAALSLNRDEPQWVKDMRIHHARTGNYRASDVSRVLGDPRVSVQSSSVTNTNQSPPLENK
jgi:hypothetical protein